MQTRKIAIAIVNKINDSYSLNLKTVESLSMTDEIISVIESELERENEEQENCAHPRQCREYIGQNTLRCKKCGKEMQ